MIGEGGPGDWWEEGGNNDKGGKRAAALCSAARHRADRAEKILR